LEDNHNIEEENKVNSEEPKMTSEELEKLKEQVIITVMGDKSTNDISVKDVEEELGNEELSRLLTDETLDDSERDKLINEQVQAYFKKIYGESELIEVTEDNVKEVLSEGYVDYVVHHFFELENPKRKEVISMKLRDYMLIRRMKTNIFYMFVTMLVLYTNDRITTFLWILAVMMFICAIAAIKDCILRIMELGENS
jgi:hypothetical protein